MFPIFSGNCDGWETEQIQKVRLCKGVIIGPNPRYPTKVPNFMNRWLAGFLIFLLFAGSELHASDNWVQLSNTHGWSITYPAAWEAYVMQAPDSGPELSIRESENVNFDGPKDCYERKARCGHFQIYSASTTPQAEVKKYVDEETQNQKIISKEAGQLDGIPAYFIKLPDDQRLVIVKSKRLIFHISYGPNDHKPTDKTLEETFNRMMSSLKFKK
jgi:hypothetical protein